MGRWRRLGAAIVVSGMALPAGGVAVGSVAVAGGGSAATATTSVLHPPLAVSGTDGDQVVSTNWSGYAVQAPAKFTRSAASWVEPTVSCPTTGASYASFWVGIDGYASNSVEQLGTDSDCTGKGTPAYYAWYEMYPAGSVPIPATTYPVAPGDRLTASVVRTGTSYTLTLSSSRGWTFSTLRSGRHKDSSAEWVAESPALCSGTSCTLAKLADFGSVTFSGAQAAAGTTTGPISAFTAKHGPHEMTMESSGGTVRAAPGALAAGGGGFAVTWAHS